MHAWASVSFVDGVTSEWCDDMRTLKKKKKKKNIMILVILRYLRYLVTRLVVELWKMILDDQERMMAGWFYCNEFLNTTSPAVPGLLWPDHTSDTTFDGQGFGRSLEIPNEN